ncbi:MAG: hypothetical protein ACQEXC_14060 [Pseudomonadota bacterium]
MTITKHHVEKVIAEAIRRFEEESGEAVSGVNIRFKSQDGGMVIREVEVTAEPDEHGIARDTPIQRSGPPVLGD